MHSVFLFEQIKKIPVSDYLSEREIADFTEILPAKKAGWLTARFSAKKAIRDFLMENYHKNISFEKSFEKIEIVRKKFQKPICKLPFKINKKTNISISHCGNVAFAAVAENRIDGLVGCDIEKFRNFEYNTLRAFLNSSEVKSVRNAPS